MLRGLRARGVVPRQSENRRVGGVIILQMTYNGLLVFVASKAR